MKEQTSIINKADILDFAFNPDVRLKNETFTSKVAAPGSPQAQDKDENQLIGDHLEIKPSVKPKPLPTVVIGKFMYLTCLEEEVRPSLIVD